MPKRNSEVFRSWTCISCSLPTLFISFPSECKSFDHQLETLSMHGLGLPFSARRIAFSSCVSMDASLSADRIRTFARYVQFGHSHSVTPASGASKWNIRMASKHMLTWTETVSALQSMLSHEHSIDTCLVLLFPSETHCVQPLWGGGGGRRGICMCYACDQMASPDIEFQWIQNDVMHVFASQVQYHGTSRPFRNSIVVAVVPFHIVMII